MSHLTLHQMKQTIKRHMDNDIIEKDLRLYIYKIIRDNEGVNSIRECTYETNGIYIDLNKLEEKTIETIYNLINKRVNEIVMK